MDIEKLIEQLRDKGCEDCPHRDTCRDDDTAECVIRLNAATALSTLQAENERLRAELEKVMRERDAAQSLLAERVGVRGAEPITTAFGLPIDRLRELAQADREGRCVVFAPGYPVVSAYYKDEDGVFVRDVTGVVTEEEYKAALRGEQE